MHSWIPRNVRRSAFAILLVLAVAGLGWQGSEAAGNDAGLSVEQSVYGHLADGTVVDVYTLKNSRGMKASVMTLGATLIRLYVPDRDGQLANVNLCLETLDDYVQGHPLFGSVVGRYANRIAGAQFPLDGKTVEVTRNAGQHHIHGGSAGGFQRLVWKGEAVENDDSVAVRLRLVSPDGTEGFPGTLTATVTYTLNNAMELSIDYRATTDKPTVVNLTNHAYFNLAGAGSGDVLNHVMTINADAYLPADDKKIPTGELRPVAGTVMDFTQPHRIGERIQQVEGENYDHCYVLNRRSTDGLTLAARAYDPVSGRTMEVLTTKPGVQLYTAKGLNDRLKWDGKAYGPYHGFCLETQHFPDAPNKDQFPSPVLRPGEEYHYTTVFRFGIQSP